MTGQDRTVRVQQRTGTLRVENIAAGPDGLDLRRSPPIWRVPAYRWPAR
jgi:hypothetical protein